MADNLRIWSALEKTNPEHTKSFQRSGGFKGTAIKPIYNDERMTETFGPCGIGWGIGKPEYTLVNTGDGAVAVYCVAELWFMDGDKRSEPIYGVGGDFAVAKRSSGLFADDEAFKKAFTDAVGNAMKRLGMSADIHMGLFDDHKYVAERRREEAEENGDAPPPRPERRAPAPRTQAVQEPKREPPAGTFDWQVPTRPSQIEPTWEGTPPNKTIDWAEWGGKLKHVLGRCKDPAEVQEWVKLNRGPLEGMKGEKPKWYAALMADVTKRETELRDGAHNPLAA